jgi:hypothetical protein
MLQVLLGGRKGRLVSMVVGLAHSFLSAVILYYTIYYRDLVLRLSRPLTTLQLSAPIYAWLCRYTRSSNCFVPFCSMTDYLRRTQHDDGNKSRVELRTAFVAFIKQQSASYDSLYGIESIETARLEQSLSYPILSYYPSYTCSSLVKNTSCRSQRVSSCTPEHADFGMLTNARECTLDPWHIIRL